jgi:hypothetical protein
MAEPESETWPDWTPEEPATEKTGALERAAPYRQENRSNGRASYAFLVYQSALTGV